jgi:4-amino-4-deoxy-L-arabinose transferase-like glycosyltransferase
MNNKQARLFIFLFHIVALIACHIFGYAGHFGYDDLHYAGLAVDANNGYFNFDDHYTYRFPVILLTALSYRLFGVSDLASSLPSLLIAGLTLFLVFQSLKNKNNITLMIGLSLTLFSGWFIFYSDKIMPDIYVAFSVMLSLFIIHHYKYVVRKHAAGYAALLAFSLLFGFMAKETIVLILPLLLYFALADFVLKRDRKFWIYAFISGIITLSAYFILIWLLTGDFAKRFEAITGNSYLNLCSYDRQPVKFLLERISYGFVRLLIFQGMLVGFIFVFVSVLTGNLKSIFRFGHSFSFWLVSSVILFLSSNFMTISVNSYSPMCLDPRHYLFLIPVAAIPAANVINDFLKSKKHAVPIILLLVLVSATAFFLPGNSFKTLYFPLTVLFTAGFFLRKNRCSPVLFIGVLVLVLMLIPFESVRYAQKVNYRKQKQILLEQVLEKYDGVAVVTDEVQKRLGNYYLHFDKKYNATFLNYDEALPDSTQYPKMLLLLNAHTRYLSNVNFDDLPYFVRNIHPSNTMLFEDKNLDFAIYELNRIVIPSSQGTELVHSFNGFEQPVPMWDMNGNEFSKTLKYEGEQSLAANEYSAVFSVETDSLVISGFGNLNIGCEVFCHFPGKTKANLVVSIENEEGSYIWNGFPIDKFIKAYSNWWPARLEITVNTREIKSHSQLKIYIWNIEKDPAFIDNFSVTITGFDD